MKKSGSFGFASAIKKVGNVLGLGFFDGKTVRKRKLSRCYFPLFPITTPWSNADQTTQVYCVTVNLNVNYDEKYTYGFCAER